MSNILFSLRHLKTVKNYRAQIPTDYFNDIEVDEGNHEIVEPGIIQAVKALAGYDHDADVRNINYYPSPSGEYVITEWEVTVE